MKKKAVIGCGYLGKEVASIWTRKKDSVTATTRRPEKLPELSKLTQKGVLYTGRDIEELAPIVYANELLLVSIGADRPEHYENAYLHTAQFMRRFAVEEGVIRRLIYTSSISVYGDHQGYWVDETAELRAKSEQGKILLQTEHAYLSLADLGWSICVLRLGELYGPGRELSDKLAHASVASSETYTNMVHKVDAALAIDYAYRHKLEGVFNIVDDDHPTRKELFDAVSKKLHLPPVHWQPFAPNMHSGNKRVSNHKIKGEGFSFKYPHRDIR